MIRQKELTPATFPVSSRGCWLSLAERDARHGERHKPLGNGLYLRNHAGSHLNDREIVLVELLRNGRKVAYRAEMGVGRLCLRPRQGHGHVELLLLAPGTVRIRAEGGCGLRLSVKPVPGNVAFALAETLFALNVRSARMRLQVECLAGGQELDAPWKEDFCEHIRVRLLPGADGSGEWALDRYLSTWKRPRRPAFAKERERLEKGFGDFEDKQPEVPRAYAGARRLAALINWSCLVDPQGRLERPAMLMSKGWMDQVWSWDNCFNAMALGRDLPQLALDQLLTVVDRQDEHGVYPDAMNDVHEHYCFNKPPVWGLALRELRAMNPRYFTARRLSAVAESVKNFTDWWLEHRRLPGRRLCYYLHGNDSGWDNSTQFDEGVPLEAADLNAFLITQAEELARLADERGRKREAGRMRKVADELTAALLEELWAGDGFVGLRGGKPVRSESLIPCMPLVLGERLPADVRRLLVRRLKRHLTRWGPATEDPESKKYSADGYWRGPIWGPSTVLIVLGLERCGEAMLARTVSSRFAQLCRKSGFAENFDALSGEPLRDPAYSWTASCFLFLANRLVRATK